MTEQINAARRDRIDRRAMLRRGGVAVAGVAGASTMGVVAAPSAGAAPGDPVLQGDVNNAGFEPTKLTSEAPDATLELANTNPAANVASLNLAPVADPNTAPTSASRAGDLFNYGGELLQTHLGVESGVEFPHVGWVHTSYTSNTLVPITPDRVINTRELAGRSRIMNKGVLDSHGRVKSGNAIKVRLDDYVFFGDVMNCNVTAVKPVDSGYLSLLPEKPSGTPSTSNVNYSRGQVIANFAVTPIGSKEHFNNTSTPTDYIYIYIYAFKTTHVVLDATGFVVQDYAQVNPGFAAAQTSTSDETKAQRQRLITERIAARRGTK